MPLVLVVLLALGGVAVVVATGSGPKLGLDLEGGYAVTLQPVEDANEDTLDQAIAIIRTRVDALGVAEPEITRQGETIVVSLPGVSDRERAEELVGQTAELRFRPTLCPVLTEVPDATPDDAAADDVSTTSTTEPDTTDTTATETTEADEATDVEGQGAAGAATPFQDEPTDTTQPDTTIDVGDTGDQAPPTSDPVCSAVLSGAVDQDTIAVTPREEDDADEHVTLVDQENGGRWRLGPAYATGEIISDATARLGPTGEWFVELDIRGGEASEAFNRLASDCFNGTEACPYQRSAVVLDSGIVSILGYQTPSFEGSAQITGSFSEGEAKDLALVLRYGALPVALEAQQSVEVSATLGQDSLRAGVISGIVGLVLVAAYMIVYYRLLGLVAILSLAVSAALLWGVVSWLGESQGLALTLAGITGIIVSIGIAVDSNVVFYEHLKEDVVRGRSLRTAVTGSFTSAFRVIVKADVATLIGAVLLYWLTVGPVRGFAFFLGLSTLLDIVASYFFMRPFVVKLAKSRRFLDRPRALGMPDAEAAT